MDDSSIQLSHEFPADGQYRMSFGATDRHLRTLNDSRYLSADQLPPPRIMTMKLDGTRIGTKAITEIFSQSPARLIFPRIFEQDAPVAEGRLDGRPWYVSYANTANANASLASPSIPKSLLVRTSAAGKPF